ncbi:MAG: hypothetical protein AAGC95_03870 [Pseudomonadota bacterium]
MKRLSTLLAGMAFFSAGAVAHEPPSTPIDPGPVPEILFEYPVLAVFPDTAALAMNVKSDATVSYIENNYQDMSKSVNSTGKWTWENNDFCMYVDDHIVCFKLEDELTPGLIYDTNMRLLDEKGEEEASLSLKWMLVR